MGRNERWMPFLYREFWRGFFGFFYPPLLPPGEHLFDRWFRRG